MRLRSRRHHHVARGRSRRPALREHHVVVVAPLQHLRAFLREPLHHPVLRVLPPVVDLLRLGRHRQAIVGERDHQAGAQEEIPPAVGIGDVAWIDPADLEVDRVAPGPADAVGPDDVVRSVRGADAGEVDVVAPLVLHEIRRPDRADVLEQRRPHRLPVDQVAGMPDDEARIGVERRERHVVVVAVLENRRVRVVARHDRIQKRAVAEVRLPLAFDAAGPGPPTPGPRPSAAATRRRGSRRGRPAPSREPLAAVSDS